MRALILVLKLRYLLYNGVWVEEGFMQRAPVFILFSFYFIYLFFFLVKKKIIALTLF